jgi:ABC-type branched-subunit amino acid transport system substrate-binding protein
MGWDSAELVDERLGAARYVQCSVFVDGFYNRSQRAATQKFVETFESTYKRLPLLLEAHAHDAAGILKTVIAERKPQTREDLRDALASMQKPFEGAAGDTAFDKDREPKKQLFWLWIDKGNIIEFDPTGKPPVPLVPSAQAAIEGEQKQ